MVLQDNFFLRNQKRREIIGFLDRLPKNAFNYFLLSPCNKFYDNNNIMVIMIMQDTILLLKMPIRTGNVYSKIIDNLGMRSEKGSPALA
jgi:hypothetical protein